MNLIKGNLQAKFGKYLLLDHIVDGGMAAIYRARELSESQNKLVAEKIVAIKVIKEQHSNDEGFKEMFLDEIKVAYGLIHPNIAQTYNYGEFNDQLYAVLEYVDGKNLKQYIDLLRKNKQFFPVEMSVYMITQICAGLDYAHKFTDKLTGQTANIVHRDISPHNIMLDYDGIIKVIDFGIAKADSSGDHTKTGTIKGKVSYIAPEYLSEDAVIDSRYDQFAVGLTLWELLTGKRLFKGPNDMAVLKKIYQCKIPSVKQFNPDVPPQLEEILYKTLSKNRDNRYGDMDKLNRALTKFLYSTYPDFNSSDLASFLNKVFFEDIENNKTKLREYGEIDLNQYYEQNKININNSKNIIKEAADYEAQEINELSGNISTNKIEQLRTKKHIQIVQKQKERDNERRKLVKDMVFGGETLTNKDDTTISDFIKTQRNKSGKPIPFSCILSIGLPLLFLCDFIKTQRNKSGKPIDNIQEKGIGTEDITEEIPLNTEANIPTIPKEIKAPNKNIFAIEATEEMETVPQKDKEEEIIEIQKDYTNIISILTLIIMISILALIYFAFPNLMGF